jgi:hypothetical protein
LMAAYTSEWRSSRHQRLAAPGFLLFVKNPISFVSSRKRI